MGTNCSLDQSYHDRSHYKKVRLRTRKTERCKRTILHVTSNVNHFKSSNEFKFCIIGKNIWINIFYYLNANEFLNISQICKYFHNLTNDSVNNKAIERYWKIQSRLICSENEITLFHSKILPNLSSYDASIKWYLLYYSIVYIYHKIDNFFTYFRIKFCKRHHRSIHMNQCYNKEQKGIIVNNIKFGLKCFYICFFFTYFANNRNLMNEMSAITNNKRYINTDSLIDSVINLIDIKSVTIKDGIHTGIYYFYKSKQLIISAKMMEYLGMNKIDWRNTIKSIENAANFNNELKKYQNHLFYVIIFIINLFANLNDRIGNINYSNSNSKKMTAINKFEILEQFIRRKNRYNLNDLSKFEWKFVEKDNKLNERFNNNKTNDNLNFMHF